MSKAKARKKKGGDLKSHKISTLHAKGRNPSVSSHTQKGRLELKGGTGSFAHGTYYIRTTLGGQFPNITETYQVSREPFKGATATDYKSARILMPARGPLAGKSIVPNLAAIYSTGKRSVRVGNKNYTIKQERGGLGGRNLHHIEPANL